MVGLCFILDLIFLIFLIADSRRSSSDFQPLVSEGPNKQPSRFSETGFLVMYNEMKHIDYLELHFGEDLEMLSTRNSNKLRRILSCKHVSPCYEASRNCELIISKLEYPFLCIVLTSTVLDYIKFLIM